MSEKCAWPSCTRDVAGDSLISWKTYAPSGFERWHHAKACFLHGGWIVGDNNQLLPQSNDDGEGDWDKSKEECLTMVQELREALKGILDNPAHDHYGDEVICQRCARRQIAYTNARAALARTDNSECLSQPTKS